MKKFIQIIFTLILIFNGRVVAQNDIDVLIFNRDYEAALMMIENEIALNPSATLLLKKGLVLNNIQNYQEALIAFEMAFRFDSVNNVILAETAECLSVLGNYQDAIKFYLKAVQLQPNNLVLTAKLGRNYINLKEYKNAYHCFSEVYGKDSSNIYWNKQLAFCAFKTGNKSQAVYLYRKILDQNPRDYSSYFNLLRLFEKGKEDSLILTTIEKGLLNFPGDAEFYNERGKYYFEIKQYESAKSDYESYFTAGGDSLYQVLMNYGISSFFAKDENKAISILEICMNQVANDPYVLFYLSLSYKKLKNFEVSENYMNAAIEAATPAYLPDFYHYLGQILGQQRKFKESIAALQKANELDPENVETLFEIATTYEEFSQNKALAANYYRLYLKAAAENGDNVNYALDRLKKFKEDQFFKE